MSMTLLDAVARFDDWFIRQQRRYGILSLRVSLGLVFVWFGTLKVVGRSPVEDLVANTVYWVDPGRFVPLLGAWEILVGLGLLAGVLLRGVLLLFWLQLAGTFLVLLVQPGVAFQAGNPLVLTTEGEFVVKNLVLIAAGIVVGGSLRRLRPSGAPVGALRSVPFGARP